MSRYTPIKVLQSIEMIYGLLTQKYSQFSFFKPTDKCSFDEKVKFVKTYSNDDIKKFIQNNTVQTRVVLAKVLEDIMKAIDSVYYQKYHVNFQQDLEEIFSEFQNQLRNVYIRVDDENRVLLHYSTIPTYSRDWNNLTKYSRGIVIDLDTYQIVVHPYDKFYNYMEREETKTENLPDSEYEVSVKLDGSEGILYPTKSGEIKIITKGGLDTEQGRFGTKILWEKYSDAAKKIASEKLYQDYTYVFEILYDKNDINRIVVAYEEKDLRLIGVRDLKTGKTLSYKEVIRVAKNLGFAYTEIEKITLEEILDLKKDKENFEGWVVRYDNELYMKIKCDPYLDAHGARFGTSIKAVFRLIKDGKWDDFISSLAEENRGIPEALYKRLVKFATYQAREISLHYDLIPHMENQRDFGLYVQQNVPREMMGYMFAIRSGKEIDVFDQTWNSFKSKFESWESKQNQ
ncbi:RNA ligase [compost metagenome]